MPSDPRFAFLPTHGEMAQRIRAMDWESTQLGSPAQWPDHLRNALSLCLSSRFPILIMWGPEFRLLYNDAYISFLGDSKHPASLGQPAPVVWSEIWDAIAPMLNGVHQTGHATWSDDAQYFFDRALQREEVYVTFTYGPILAADGITVDGIFVPCTQTTEKVISARRMETLGQLSRHSLEMRSMAQASQQICTVLENSPYDVAFAIIYRYCDDTSSFHLQAAAGLDPQLAAAPQMWPLLQVACSRMPELMDLAAAGLALPGGAWPEAATMARIEPLMWGGENAVSGVMVLGVSPRRPLDAAYCSFLTQVASHTSSALANAAAYEEESSRAQALAEIDRAKTSFFSNVSHEFRTPLTLILGPLEDALRSSDGTLAPEHLSLVHRNALRLQKLVNTLLDFSRIEAGRVQARYEATDLATTTAELASVFRAAIESADMVLEVDCVPLSEPVYVDRDMYEKIVLNLLSNAFKFTLQGTIAISLHTAKGAAELKVRDTGCGVPAQHLPRLFERFHRIEGQPARSHEGTGIGLALVHELVRLHRGDMTVESIEGVGTTFTVYLPLGRTHLPPSQVAGDSQAFQPIQGSVLSSSPPTPPPLRHWLPDGHGAVAAPEQAAGADTNMALPSRARILCADDNADMRSYLRHLLAPRYTLEIVADGEAALASIHRQRPDLVLSDIMMPRLDGLGLLQALRSRSDTHTLPVILLSARAGQEAQLDGLQAGADDYLFKPFAAPELLARIEAHLRLARQREATLAALRANEKHLRAIIEQLPAGVGVTDLQGRWVISNTLMDRYVPQAIPSVLPAQAARWRGWDSQGQPVPPDQWPGKRALRGEFVVPGVEMLCTDTDGSTRWMRVSAAPLCDTAGVLVGACSVVQDISELKQAEHHLKEADRRKDEFLATLAHELRNPLAPICNGLQLLRQADEDNGNATSAAQASYALLDRQVGHLVRLVDDLLEVSRITTGKFQLRKQAVDLADIVRTALETTRPAIDSAGHNLVVELPMSPLALNADPMRLAQAVSNLLHNAAKYTEPAGHIRVRAWREGDRAQLAVEDNGIGIAATLLPHIFDPFIQADHSYERAQGGLGIGLTLVRRMVEMHGGTVEAQSAGYGQGSRFVLALPLQGPLPQEIRAQTTANGPPTEPPLPASSAPLGRLLIVDDNIDAADSLGTLLGLLGAEVEIAYDGPSALAKHMAAGSGGHDAILLDLGLPGMNGLEVARRLREPPCSSQAVLIALTGWGQQEDVKRSQAAGIDHHLVKPVSLPILEQLLSEVQMRRSPPGELGPDRPVSLV